MYWEYLKEREGVEVIEREYGFALVRMESPDVIYLKDIYVKPEFRKQGKCSELAKEIEDIGRELGAKYIQGSVSPYANGATESMIVMIKNDYKLHSSDLHLIYFTKEL